LGEIMSDLALYEDEKEQKQHFSAIQRLVRDVHSPEEEIRHLYEDVLKEFKSEARIKTFLSILVSKKVKELLDARRR
jgi:acyl-[acyl carrier protein]--UDP-N-acetylglucosamine O-acyltransferase